MILMVLFLVKALQKCVKNIFLLLSDGIGNYDAFLKNMYNDHIVPYSESQSFAKILISNYDLGDFEITEKNNRRKV